MTRHSLISSVLTLALYLSVAAAGPRSAYAADSTLVKWSTNDGPHVYWSDDSTAIVFYYCDDSVVSRIFPVRDTLRFNGFCGDTDQSYTVPLVIAGPGPDRLTNIERFFVLSDIHGDYDHLAEILLNSGVIDSAGNWRWGDGHLVINGDLFDRGAQVTDCAWLLYRLDQEAARVGGAVHMLLGNHELMVLRGDLRYVHERYTEGIARRNRFTYDDLFGPDMALGRWLRTQHTALVINRSLFVHGGIAAQFASKQRSLSALNALVRSGLDYSSPRLYFDTLVRAAYGTLGPLWYRGYTTELEDRYPSISLPALDSILAFYQTDRAVVGHTEHDSLTVLHEGRVIAIDVDIEALGGLQGLLWESGQWYRVEKNGDRVNLRLE